MKEIQLKARRMKPIDYPVTVDAKKLWALIRTGDAIIRNPKPDRIVHWRSCVKIIAAQCNSIRTIDLSDL